MGETGEVGSGDAIKGVLHDSYMTAPVSIKAAGENAYVNAWDNGRVSGNTLVKNWNSVDNNSKWAIQQSEMSDNVYNIKIHDSPLYINSQGGHGHGKPQQLHSDESIDGSVWNFEPSTSRLGHFYIKAHNSPYYMQLSGGTGTGRQISLGSCDKAKDMSRCQWLVRKA